jgi:hypothetical protein
LQMIERGPRHCDIAAFDEIIVGDLHHAIGIGKDPCELYDRLWYNKFAF